MLARLATASPTQMCAQGWQRLLDQGAWRAAADLLHVPYARRRP